MRNLKHHAIAIISICAIIFVVYFLMTPDQPTETVQAPKSTRLIQISSATWGGNCDVAIDAALKDRQSKPLPTDENGNVIPQPVLAHAKLNNALQVMSDICNGQPSCEFVPSNDTMGAEPMAECPKKLEVGYRCSSFEKLSTVTIEQDRTLTIDCNDATAPAPTK